jgi:hypothetical protein
MVRVYIYIIICSLTEPSSAITASIITEISKFLLPLIFTVSFYTAKIIAWGKVQK